MHHSHHDGTWQQREHQRPHTRRHHVKSAAECELSHWVRTGAILAPLIISEVVKEPGQKLRFIRITSIAAAMLSEGLHAHKTYKDRERDREALAACEMSCATL